MNVLFVEEAGTAVRNAAKLDRWRSEVRNGGDQVERVTVASSLSVIDVSRVINVNGCDLAQLVGNVTVPLVYWDPDGHGGRPGSLDAPYATASLDGWGYNPQTNHFQGVNNAWGFWPTAAVRSVSRVYFDGMSNIVADPGAAMDAFLDRNHAVRTGAFFYNRRAALACYIEYLFPGITEREASDLAAIVDGADRVDRLNAPTVEEVYHWFDVNQGKSFLAGALFDGGASRGEDGGIGEYNTGSEHDFASGKVQICLLEMYCSWAWQWDVWPLMRAALVGGSQFVWYDPAGRYPLTGWDEQTPIAKVAQRHHNQYSQQLATGIGDGTLRRPVGGVDEMSQADIDLIHSVATDFAAFKNRAIATFPQLGDGTVNQPPPPGTNYCREVGARAEASSSYDPRFSADKAINGDRLARSWEQGGGWCSANPPGTEWLRVTFSAPQTINRVVVIGLQDNYRSATEPTDTMTGSLYVPQNFSVRWLVGGVWQAPVQVTGNNLIKRTVSFASVAGAQALEVAVTQAAGGLPRLVEVEAYGS